MTDPNASLYAITISNDVLQATILNFGARLIDLRLQGHGPSLVLGLAELSDHMSDATHMGAIAGPVANRIAGATASLNGQTYHFETNEHEAQTLHGGHYGTSRQFWQLCQINDTMVQASLTQEDGMLGFPGTRDITALYRLDGNRLHIYMSCTTDAPSWCNLAPHAYFNLDGSQTIQQHHLQINAQSYLPVDDRSIPTGTVKAVKDTEFDFLEMRSLSDYVYGQKDPIDHNYCLATPTPNQKKTRQVAALWSEASRIKMELFTDQAGLQTYFSQFLADGTAGSDGRIYGPFSAICLEPQGWPDALNQAAFPSVEISPHKSYLSHSCFAFSKT